MSSNDANVVHVEQLDVSNLKPISEVKRFTLLVIGSLCCICCSFSYAFNLISSVMQARYELDQRDLVTISSVGTCFMFFALPYAFIFDYFGPVPVSVLSCFTFPIGALCIALSLKGRIRANVGILSVFNALMGAGSIQFDLISMMATISYFPSNKGAVTALLKTFTGLGQALVGTLYIGYFNRKTEDYLFFLMAFAIVVGILAVIFLRLPEYQLTGYQMKKMPAEEQDARSRTKAQFLRQRPPMWRFVWGFTVIIFLIVFLPIQSALVAYLPITSRSATIAFAIVATIAVLVFLMLAMPVPSCFSRRPKDTDNEPVDSDGMDIDEEIARIEQGEKVLGTDTGSTEHDKEEAVAPVETEVDYIAPQYQGTFLRNLLTPELWALFWSFFVIIGAEFVVIFNSGYLFTALQESPISPELRSLLTVLNGTGSAVGRLIMSVFEVWTQKRKAEDRIPITISLFPPTISVLLSLVLFLVLPAAALPVPFILIALGNGFINAAIVLTTRTIYAKDNAKHYNFCFLAMSFAAIVFNRGLYAEWYVREADKLTSTKNHTCYSRKCVQTPLIILICLGSTAFATNLFSHLRYRKFCQRTLAQRALMREEAMKPTQKDEQVEAVEVNSSENQKE